MLTQAWNSTADSAVALLLHYIFDLGGHNARELVERWLRFYPANWVRLAAIEALYQGRYKAVSVEQILSIWQRRGQIQPHFNCEFERLVCGNIQPRLSAQPSYPLLPEVHYRPIAIAPVTPLNRSARRTSGAITDTTSTQPRQLNDVARHLHKIRANASHKRSAAVAVVEIAPNATSATAEKRQASDRESQRDRHESDLKRYHPLPSSASPKSSGSFHQPPIRQFNPGTTKASDFYTKLKAISQYH
ncbi:hypothetical protein H6G17_10735 [Chroococcidiopsis sp. FACHB-1243]|uniref:hypothetical protein n=1 Tax=Chroococcidiopsis sp. [FACHB-1243] TaxID=2692781 RepID=UPI00177E7D0B|nr:hypothetical protein [Chroococcidiopsis sp. [FACHB-1243]]MBD2305987.1 hypothetical protein [Chroococcidiopsis sp. [FACHB-1243]]